MTERRHERHTAHLDLLAELRATLAALGEAQREARELRWRLREMEQAATYTDSERRLRPVR